MHMLAALDLTTGKLFYRIKDRKRWIEFLDLLKALARPLARHGRSKIVLIGWLSVRYEER
jgi:hypothetical protein